MEKTASAIRSETLVNIAALRRTPAFAWYVEKCIQPLHDEAERTLHAVRGVTKEEREIAAHLAAKLREVLGWVDDQYSRHNGDDAK